MALPTSSQSALLAAVAEACGDSAENDDGAAASLSPAVPEPPVAMPDAAPAPASLMLALLSEAAVATAPPDSPERAAREAAAADDHQRSCALLRALSSGDAMDVDDAPMAPAMPALQTPPEDDDAALPATMEPPATRPDEAVASDAALRAFAAELRGARADAAQPACAEQEQPLPAPPALGARCASAEPRLLHAALLHALVLAPALAPPAAHVRTLPPPFVLPDAAAPTPAALIMAAARAGGAAAAPGIAARAELELPWGADAEALASARGARVAAARLPQRLATDGEAPAPARSIMQLLDAEPDAQPQHEEPEAPVAPPAAIAPPPPMRAPPARTAGALAAIHGRDADDVARFARQLQPGSAAVSITAPEPRLQCHQLPHSAAWRALRSAAAGVAARDVARYDARDAAALTDDDQSAPDADPFWAGGPDLDALRQRIRAVAASAPGHAASLAACYALHAAAQTLALCGARAAAAYLDGAMRAAPAIAEQPTAMAAARAALAAAVKAVTSPQEDHPACAATLRAAMLAAAGGKLAVIADARAAPMAAAAMAAACVRMSVLEHGGAFETAACGGDAAGAAAALRDAAAGCDALLMTHAQAGHAGGALSQLFTAAALLSPPPPGPAAAIAALLTTPRRSFAGAVHVCVVRPPCHVTPPPAPPPAVQHHRHQPPAPMPQPQPPATAAPLPQAAPASRPSYGDDGDDDGGFATGLVALGARSAVLRSWPALRDAILRLEGRRRASVATRELGAPGESDSTSDAAAALLRTPDALALGPAGAVVALRVLRGGAEAALLAAAAGIEPHSLAAECAALAARSDALALVIIAASPAAARAIAPHAAIVAAAAASAALPLRLVVAGDDSAGRDAVLAALDWALDAPPDRQPSALRALPDAAPAGEALLRCCGGLNALAAHALLCSGVPLAALLRADLTDAGAVAAAAAAGGVALSEASLRAFDAFRAAQLGAPPAQEAPPEPEPAWQPQPWEAAQAAAGREAWRAAPSPQGGWREAHAAAAAQQQQQHYARPPAPPPVAHSPSPSLDDDDVAALFDDPPPSAAWALPAIAPQPQRAQPQPASSAAMGPPAGCRPVVSAGYGGDGDGGVRGLLDDWLKKVRALHETALALLLT